MLSLSLVHTVPFVRYIFFSSINILIAWYAWSTLNDHDFVIVSDFWKYTLSLCIGIFGTWCLVVLSYHEHSIFYSICVISWLIIMHTDTLTQLIPTIHALSCPAIIVGIILHTFPLTILQSFFGALLGGGILLLTKFLHKKIKKIEGLGLGDIFLIIGIGIVLGPTGCWLTLILGSCIGSIVGILLWFYTKTNIALPFGAFLSGSACFVILYLPFLQRFFLFS